MTRGPSETCWPTFRPPGGNERLLVGLGLIVGTLFLLFLFFTALRLGCRRRGQRRFLDGANLVAQLRGPLVVLFRDRLFHLAAHADQLRAFFGALGVEPG